MSSVQRALGAAFLLLAALAALACGGDETSAQGGGAPAALPEKDWDAERAALLAGPDWYRHAVVYEVFVRSFQDSDGDGVGDFRGLTSRLDALAELGVDALWLMPIMPTPFLDSGYDVADYQGINPDYGTDADFDAFLAAAHERGMRVIIDLVLNHTSDQHAWFAESRSDRENPRADWYVWSDTAGTADNGCGTQSPVFGDSAWEFDETRGQYYFHRFYPEQPDLDYRNPEVVEATLDVARFWLDRGVDGFRCDVIGLLHESADECELLEPTRDYIRQLRDLVDGYPGRVLLAEPGDLTDASPYFGDGGDMFHLAFDFAYGYFWGLYFNSQTANSLEIVFGETLASYPPGAQDALVIGSHDVQRAIASSLDDETRHRRAALIQMTMKGTPVIYYGEELGLRPGDQQLIDVRDRQRTPMLWDGGPGFGFTTGTPWLAFGEAPELTHRAVEEGDDASTLTYYRELLGLRRGRAVWGVGQAEILAPDSDAVLAFRRSDDFMSYVVAINMTDEDATAVVPIAGVGERADLVFGAGAMTARGDKVTLEIPAKEGAVFRTR